MAGKRTIDRERVLQLDAKGLTPAQIASRVGCSEKSVRRILKEHEEGK